MPRWVYCRYCDLHQQASAAGPPAGKDARGWHLEWHQPSYEEVSRV